MPRFSSIYRRAKHQRAIWTPAMGNPALWLDTFDPSGFINVSGAASQLTDKSGFGKHFPQGNSALRPAIDKVLRPQSLLWDGSNDELSHAAESWAYSYPVSFFVSLRAVAWTASYNSPFDFYSDTGGATAGWAYFIKSNGKSAIYTTQTDGGQRSYDGSGALTFSTGTTHILCGTIGDGFINTWGNGVADGSASGSWTQRTNVGISLIELGSGAKFNRWTNWRIREAVVFTGKTLTTLLRQRMEGYMAHRAASFGDLTALSALAASHPFKNRPPLIGD